MALLRGRDARENVADARSLAAGLSAATFTPMRSTLHHRSPADHLVAADDHSHRRRSFVRGHTFIADCRHDGTHARVVREPTVNTQRTTSSNCRRRARTAVYGTARGDTTWATGDDARRRVTMTRERSRWWPIADERAGGLARSLARLRAIS